MPRLISTKETKGLLGDNSGETVRCQHRCHARPRSAPTTRIGGDVRIAWFHVIVAAAGLLVWAVLHLAVPFVLGAFVARRWPALARFLPHAAPASDPHPPAQAQTFAAFQAQRDARPLISPEPDRQAMQARYDEAIYAQLEGRELTSTQQRIVQFHYHGEGCQACAAGRSA
jgi:hypothetical protein